MGALLNGALSIGAFFGFVYWGLQEAPAGVAGVFLATGPLLTFLLALLHGQERFRWDSSRRPVAYPGASAKIPRPGRY